MRRERLALLVAACLVAIAEVSVRLAAPHLPGPLTWNDYAVQAKAQRLEDLRKAGLRVPVVLAGSSSMNAAGDPELLADLTGRRTYNAALNGADMRSVAAWVEQVVLAHARPSTVVVGTTSLELNDNGLTQAEFRRGLLRSDGLALAAGRAGITDRLEGALQEASALVRYRSVLRRPATISEDRASQRRGDAGAWGTLDALEAFHARDYAITPSFRQRTRDRSFHRFAVGGPQVEALERLIARLDRAGVRTVLVKLPVTTDVLAIHPGGAKDYRRYEAALAGVVARTGVRFIDASARIGDRRWFVDPLHLNAAGSQRFTQLLAGAIPTPPRTAAK